MKFLIEREDAKRDERALIVVTREGPRERSAWTGRDSAGSAEKPWEETLAELCFERQERNPCLKNAGTSL